MAEQELSPEERDRILRERFSWNDSDVTFRDDAGNALTHDQVRAMQAEAEEEEKRMEQIAAAMREDERDRQAARKKAGL